MPTREFLERLTQVKDLPPNGLIGSRPEVFADLDGILESIIREEDDIDPRDEDRITSKLLRVGPCPSTSRVYYALTSEPQFPSAEEKVDELLGHELEETKLRRKLGIVLERWIDKANKAVNEWLRTRETNPLTRLDIPERIKGFYLGRLPHIEAQADDLGIELEDFEMEVQTKFLARFFHEAEPDGSWLLEKVEGLSGGVFESKLSALPTPVDKYVLTGYAVYLERARELPVDVGVYLYLDPDLEKLIVESFYINDNFRDEIRTNVSRLSTLIFKSREAGEWEEGGSLEGRLIEPEEPDFMAYCTECPYAEECHRDRE